MRRFVGFAAVAVTLLLGLIAVNDLVSGAGAQDATPPPGGFEIAPGVTAELLPAAEDPPSLYRLTFAPDVTYPFEGNPAVALGYFETGTLTVRLDAPVTIARADAAETPGETVAAGTDFTVTAGDYFVLPPMATGVIRNDGPESAAFSVAEIVPTGMATPTAGTPGA